MDDNQLARDIHTIRSVNRIRIFSLFSLSLRYIIFSLVERVRIMKILLIFLFIILWSMVLIDNRKSYAKIPMDYSRKSIRIWWNILFVGEILLTIAIILIFI